MFKSILGLMLIGTMFAGCLAATESAHLASADAYPARFEEVCRLVEAHFFDAAFIAHRFETVKTEYGVAAEHVSSEAGFSNLINSMLGRLGTSHTRYLTPREVDYYQLASVFRLLPEIQTLFDHRKIQYPSVGMFTESIEGRVFINVILAGGVASQSGVQIGDEIVAVDGKPYHPIDSLKDREGRQVVFTIRRQPGGAVRRFPLVPVLANPREEMLAAQKASIRLIARNDHKFGYIHIYSYAGQKYQDALVDAITRGSLSNADALIIDLRYGIGGAAPSYLNIFNPNVPVLTSWDNAGNTYHYDRQWRKPAVLLINRYTRSGKEIFAFGAQKYGLATLIGERTAGAVVAGRLFPISNGDLLYLAVKGARVDGMVLEGIGVNPDIHVPMDIRHCEGSDPQLERALAFFDSLLAK